jgi:hypothetical protein
VDYGIANLLAIVSASMLSFLLRDLPSTAEEKRHALATNETRRRKRRIAPEEVVRSSNTADNVVRCLSSGLELERMIESTEGKRRCTGERVRS